MPMGMTEVALTAQYFALGIRQVEYIMQRFKRVMENVPEEVTSLPFTTHPGRLHVTSHSGVFVTMRGEAWDGGVDRGVFFFSRASPLASLSAAA